MADDYTSDEEKYANETFENETDTDLPEISDAASDNYSENGSDNDNFAYTRYQTNRLNKDFVPYTSSSEEDDDVVISKTIAEINPEPMMMEDALVTPKVVFAKNLDKVAKVEEVYVVTEQSDSESEAEQAESAAESEPVSEAEQKRANNSSKHIKSHPQIAKSSPKISNEAEQRNNVSNRSRNINHNESSQQASNINNNQSRIIKKNDTERQNENDYEQDHEENESNEQNTKMPQYGRLQNGYTELPYEENTHRELVPNGHFAIDDTDEIYTESTVCETENDAENYGMDPRIEFCISSRTPSSFNPAEYAFHMNFTQKSSSASVRMKQGPRKSWSFTNERVREIERQNQILLKKILSQKTTYNIYPKNSKSSLKNSASTASTSNPRRTTTAAVNRKKQQRQIDLDNQVLKRKIEAISSRRPHMQHL